MKRIISIILALCLTLLLFASCGTKTPTNNAVQPGSNTNTSGSTEVIVFAAASLQETLTELGKAYETAHPGVKIVFTFESSGTLKKQIQEGSACDVFISAGQKQMNQLDINADPAVNTEKLDFVAADTRFNILENKIALAVPEKNTKGIKSYDDLKKHLQDGDIVLAMGDADVPVGQYTQKILTYFGLSEEELAKKGAITYGTNVKDVTSKVSEAAVDCGIIYQTDAFSAGLTVVDTATEEMCGQVIYPAAVMKSSADPKAAQDFLNFLMTPQAAEVFKKVGFTPLN